MSQFGEKVATLMRLRDPVEINAEQLQEQANRGNQAADLLRNEALQLAFRQLDEGYQNIWRTTSPDDYDIRERAWTSLKLLDDLRNLLLSTVRNGAVARDRLEKSLRR